MNYIVSKKFFVKTPQNGGRFFMEYDGKIVHKVPSCLTPNSSLYEAPYVFPGRFMCDAFWYLRTNEWAPASQNFVQHCLFTFTRKRFKVMHIKRSCNAAERSPRWQARWWYAKTSSPLWASIIPMPPSVLRAIFAALKKSFRQHTGHRTISILFINPLFRPEQGI